MMLWAGSRVYLPMFFPGIEPEAGLAFTCIIQMPCFLCIFLVIEGSASEKIEERNELDNPQIQIKGGHIYAVRLMNTLPAGAQEEIRQVKRSKASK